MGNFLTRAARAPKAMLLASLLLIPSIMGMGVLPTATASADGVIGQTGATNDSMFVVKLSGSSNPSQYSVSAKRQGDGKVVSFKYNSGQKEFDSDFFPWGGDNTVCINNSNNPSNTAKEFTWDFTVSVGGKTAGTKGENYCGNSSPGAGQVWLVTVPVTDGTTGSGSVTGTLAYVAPDGTTQPFRSNTVATLKGPNGTTNISFTDSGTFNISNISPGTYTLNADFAPTDLSHGEVSGHHYQISNWSVPVSNGTTTNVALTVDGNGKVTQGANITQGNPADCSSTDANGNCVGSGNDTINCGSGNFNWIVCPAIQLALTGAEQMENFIINTLDIDVGPIFDQTTAKGSASNGYYMAWSSFRVLATALLVIGGLIMVASQAMGFEFLDAYTIRKVLPRILVAIIGISLSWPLMRLAVSFVDNLGVDLRQIMYYPFRNMGGSISVTGGILSTLGVAAAIFALGWTSLTLIGTVLLAVLVAFLTLVLREIVLIMLIIVAPIGIAAYILPNTQRVWHLWRDNFFGLLLVFPVVSGILAAGNIVAAVAIKSSSSILMEASSWIAGVTGLHFTQTIAATANNLGGIWADAIGIGAKVGSEFSIPLATRVVVGSFGNLAGFINNPSKGGFDRLKQARGNALASRYKAAQSQSLFSNSTARGRFGNKVATWLTDPVNNAAYYGRDIPGLRRRGQSVASHIEHAKAEQTGKLFEELNKAGYNDKAYRALSGAHDGFTEATKTRLHNAGLLNKAPVSMGDMQKMANILGQSDSDSERIAANAIHGSMGRLDTLYQDEEMRKASIAGAGIMGLAAHGFAETSDLSQVGNTLQKEGGASFAQSVISQAQVMGSRSRPDGKPGYGVTYDHSKKEFVDGMKEGNRARDVIKSISAHDMAGAKGGAFKALKPHLEHILDKSAKDYNPAEAAAVRDQLFSWAGPYSQASVDIKARAIDFINAKGAADSEFQSAWVKYARMEDPSVRTGGGGGGGDDSGGGATGGP